MLSSAVKPEFAFHVINTFDFEKFGNNGMDLAYILKANKNGGDEYVNSFAGCYLEKDSIILIGGLAYSSGIIFRITIVGDTYNCEVGLEAEKNIYAKDVSKGSLLKEITLKADSTLMIVSEKPKPQIGSIIKGKLKIKAQPFYQLDSNQKAVKIFPEFEIIFDTKVGEKEKD